MALKAKNKLSEADFNLTTRASSVEDVLQEVQTAQLKNESERKAVDRFVARTSKSLVLRLERFDKALDVMTQSTKIAALLWGSLRFMIAIGRDIFDTFDRALDCLERITNALPRFESYKAAFDLNSAKLLQAPLTNIYADILEFCMQTIKLYKRGRITWKTLKHDFDLLIVRLQSNGDEVDKFALAQHMLDSKERHESTVKLHQQTHELLSSRPIPDKQSDQVFEVPGLLSVYFTGRRQELDTLKSFLSTTAGEEQIFPRRAAIHGMAGIGKTQTALKFADMHRSSFSAILWTSAVNSIKMPQGYDRFAELLDLPEKHVQSSIDNIQEVFEFLPSNNNEGGSILFTTRSHEAAARLVGRSGVSIDLSKMDQEEGTELLLSASEIGGRDDETKLKASRIVSSIGNLPLVLDQLAFIAREAQGDLDTCAKHVEENKSMMLRHKNFNPTYHESSVTATYEAAFRKLEEDEPDAAQLFSLLSFFDPEHVATDILTENADQVEADNPLLPIIKYSLTFEKSVSQLHQFSVQRIGRRPGESRALWIHDLVQELYRERMAAPAQKKSLEQALVLLHSCFPEEHAGMSDPATWKKYEKCLPHVITGIKHANNLDAHSASLGRLCRDAGWFVYHRGQYDRAIELATISLPLLDQYYGTENDEYMSAVLLLAVVNHTKGDHKIALKMYFEVLEYRQKKYGSADITTNTKHFIALCYHEAGEYDESQRRFEEIVLHWRTKYGPDHRNTILAEVSMSRNVRYQGNPALAEDILQRIRELLLKEYGPHHIYTLVTLSELASAIWRHDRSRWQEAEAMHRQALADKIEQLGEDHIHTWDAYGDIGYMIWKCDPLGNHEAEELMMKALKPYVETLGVHHPQTREFYDCLVEFYKATDQLEKLEDLRDRFGTPQVLSPVIIASKEKDDFILENNEKTQLDETLEPQNVPDTKRAASEDQSYESKKFQEPSPVHISEESIPSEISLPSVKFPPDPGKPSEGRIAVPA